MAKTNLEPRKTYEFPLPSDGVCNINLASASLIIDKAEGEEIIVECTVLVGSEDIYEFSARSDGKLELLGAKRTNDWQNHRAEMHVQLPEGCALKAKTAAGSVLIESIVADATVKADAGNVTISNVTGALTVETTGGNLQIGSADGDVVATTRGGSVRISETSGDINASAFGGSIELKLNQHPSGKAKAHGGSIRLIAPADASFKLKANAVGGMITVREPFVEEGINTNRLTQDIGGGGDTIFEANVVGGSVILEPEVTLAGSNLRTTRDRIHDDASTRGLPSTESAADMPMIIGPDAFDRNSPEPPTFCVNSGAGRSWAVEFAERPALFDASQRSEGGVFYATWDTGLFPTQTRSEYQLEPQAWEALRFSEHLFYRVVTSDKPDSWNSVDTSFNPQDGGDPPFIDLTESQ